MNLPGMAHFGTYEIIAADPPWEHDNFGQAKHGAAKAIYDEMPLAALKEMPVGALAHPQGALLFLWCTGVQAADGAHVELANAWGFRLTTRAFSWVKVADKCANCGHAWSEHEGHLVNEDAPGVCGNPQCLEGSALGACEMFALRGRRGPGSYTMQGVEDVWLGVKGDATWSKDRVRRDIPEEVFAPIGDHSVKPELVYERVEALWPHSTNRLELFSRRRRPGWAHWGAEAPSCDLVFGSEIGATWPLKKPELTAIPWSGHMAH